MTDSALGLLGVDLDQTYSASAAGNGELPFAQGEEVITKIGKAILTNNAGNRGLELGRI